MSDTTGNQNLAVATNGTSHVPMTNGPTDVCKLPNNVPSPFLNFIAVKGNLQDGTTNTFIANQPVWIQRSYIGPTSDPAHPGVNKGVGSGTYRGIAKATSWSKDVQKEGQFVVRTNDATTQNNANTTGTVLGSPLAGSVDAQDAYKKLLCTITKLEGKCGHGRELGPPPGSKPGAEANYLEILLGDKVEFISTRENLVTKAIDPGCEKAVHTHWKATKTGDSWKGTAIGAAKDVVGMEVESEEKDALKKYTLEGPLVGGSAVTVGKTTSKTANVTDHARRERIKEPVGGGGVLGVDASTVTAKNSSGTWAHGDAVTHKVAPDSNADKIKAKVIGGLKDAALMWDATAHPRIVTVDATACSGTKTATIKCLPKDKVEVELFDDSVKAAVNAVKKVLQLVERATSFFGWPARIQFLENPKLQFVIEYKELTADKPAKSVPFGLGTLGPYYKVQCRRSWKLEMSFSPLIGGYAKFTAPIAAALPLVGSAAATLLKWVGAKGDVFVKIELNFAPKGSIAWDEYDEISIAITSTEFTLTFSLGVEIYIKVAELTVYAFIEGKLSFENWGPRPGVLIACDMKGEVQLGAKGAAKATFWGKTYSKDIEYKPECLKVGNSVPLMIPIKPKPSSGGAASP